MHPLHYNLSIATKALLGLAVTICSLVVLRHSEHPEDQEKGFVGNTILLTQPRPQEIMQRLPPANDEVSEHLSVCFNDQKMTTADVGKHKALKIDPQEYISCSELRKKVCPVFADVRWSVNSNLRMIIQADLITRYVLGTDDKLLHRFPICADVPLREASTLTNHIFCTHQMSSRYQN